MSRTEKRNPRTTNFSKESTKTMLEIINDENMRSVRAVGDAIEDIAKAVDAVTEAFLAERFGNREIEYYDSVITPDDILSTVISYESSTVIGYLVAFAVTLAVMSICMYFIMRSSLMSRIKEIGIYRAIGVSKGNIILRFGMEALLLASTTVVFGYLLSSAFIGLLSRISPNASEIFFYPVWYALLILAVLCGLTVVCGILPVLNLLRKTPSEILAKYDV